MHIAPLNIRRGFCYDKAMRHKLTNVNLETRRATCSACDDVAIHVGSNGRRQCYYAHKYGASMVKSNIQAVNCEICGEETKTFFDHCHRKNAHRGWLCRKCNVLLGFADNDVATLQKAIDYLLR